MGHSDWSICARSVAQTSPPAVVVVDMVEAVLVVDAVLAVDVELVVVTRSTDVHSFVFTL
jgi:hypothetical protein